jgi:deoxyadenosine/deoxycytidine kinase
LSEARRLKSSIDDNKDSEAEVCFLVNYHKLINLLVSIEGNISSGKSTLVEAFHYVFDMYGDGARMVISSFLEDGHHGEPLEMALKYPKEFSGFFQIHMFDHCTKRMGMAKTTRQKAQHKTHSSLTFVDRSPSGNMIFAVVNYLCGNINNDCMHAYSVYYSKLDPYIGDMSLFLWSRPSMCCKRVENRDISVETECYVENDTSNVYLWQIAYVQMLWLMDITSRPVNDEEGKPLGNVPQLILDWNDDVPSPSIALGAIIAFLEAPVVQHRLHLHRNEPSSVPKNPNDVSDQTLLFSDIDYVSSPAFPTEADKKSICFIMSLLCQLGTHEIHLYLPPLTPVHPFVFSYALPDGERVKDFTPIALTFVD